MGVRLGAILALAIVVAALYVALRGGSAVLATASGDPEITIECSGSTGVADGCRAWGDAVLASGPPSTTFEIEDVVRVRFDRELLGFGSACSVSYFVGRYPDAPVWTEETACRAA